MRTQSLRPIVVLLHGYRQGRYDLFFPPLIRALHAAGWDGLLGKAVRIRHGSTYVTVYGHLSGFARSVRAGTEVEQNQVIGYVGSTGRATGPHLHYTLIRAGRPINPLTFQNPPAEPLSQEQQPWLAEAQRRWMPVMGSIEIHGPDYELALGDTADPTIRPGA